MSSIRILVITACLLMAFAQTASSLSSGHFTKAQSSQTAMMSQHINP
ncbi:hypothetical protein [Desulfovibrio inopinatus]|nr:hypothetical protein [Desulfovibrio inopinatus]